MNFLSREGIASSTRGLALVLGLSLVAAAPAAQSVHRVGGPLGYAEIRDALAIAAPGDVILVAPGTYAQILVTDSVTIRADVPGTVRIATDPAFLPAGCLRCPEAMSRVLLSAGETVQLVGLEFVDNIAANEHHRLRLEGGTVVIDQCTIRAQGFSALFAMQCNVHLQDSLVVSSMNYVYTQPACETYFSGLRVVDSTIELVNLSVAGGSALLTANSVFHGCTSTFRTPSWGYGVNFGNSMAWLSDSSVTADPVATCGISGGVGPAPYLGERGGIARCSVSPTGNCAPQPTRPLLSVHRPSPPTAGVPFQIDYIGEPFQVVMLYASLELSPTVLAEVEQPLLAPLDSVFVSATVTDVNGIGSAVIPIPARLPAPGLSLWIHSVAAPASGFTLPVQAAPAVGGPIR